MTTGLKQDAGKPPFSLLPWRALREVAKVLDFGRKKYTPGNWRHVRPGHRYSDALLRHLADYFEGRDRDDESGLHVLAHASCDLLYMLALELTGISCRWPGDQWTPENSFSVVEETAKKPGVRCECTSLVGCSTGAPTHHCTGLAVLAVVRDGVRIRICSRCQFRDDRVLHAFCPFCESDTCPGKSGGNCTAS